MWLLTVYNILDIWRTICAWVSIYAPLLGNPGICECLNQWIFLWNIHHFVPISCYACISHFGTEFLAFSTCNNIVVKVILWTWPWWTPEWGVMLMMLPCRPPLWLPLSNQIEYCENTYILLADTPHLEIYISPLSRTSSVWILTTQPSSCCRFSLLHQFYAMLPSQMQKVSPISNSFTEVICRGTYFH